jgi:NhaP-type Na+/H+ or K+/H+ antiporter
MTPPGKPRRSPARAVILTSLAVTIVQAIGTLSYAASTGQYIVVFSLLLTTPVAVLGGALLGWGGHWVVVLLNERRARSRALTDQALDLPPRAPVQRST